MSELGPIAAAEQNFHTAWNFPETLVNAHCRRCALAARFLATFYAHSAPIDGVGTGNTGTRMRKTATMLAILAAAACAASCQSPRSTLERTFFDPTKPYIGMSKDQVIACAGKPSGSYATTAGETLTYHYSGAGPVPTAPPAKSNEEKGPLGKPKSDKSWKCSASLSFENGRLARVTFAPRDVVSPYEKKKDPKTGEKEYVTPPEPCTFSLPNCRR